MITGGGGDVPYYSAIAGILATDYTVVTYDRRGNSRSLLRGGPATITMAQQSADAVAVLRACGFESAMIFGNSGGATIALDLAATHPQVIQTVVAHEPPVPQVLDHADDYLSIYDEIEAVLHTQGWQAAFTLFQVRIGHLPARPARADDRHGRSGAGTPARGRARCHEAGKRQLGVHDEVRDAFIHRLRARS